MQPLSAVLGLERHWSWSICTVLAVDLVACSGAMLADAWRLAPDPLAHPVGQPGADPLSCIDAPLLGVDQSDARLQSRPALASLPLGLWPPLHHEGRGERARPALPGTGSEEGGGDRGSGRPRDDGAVSQRSLAVCLGLAHCDAVLAGPAAEDFLAIADGRCPRPLPNVRASIRTADACTRCGAGAGASSRQGHRRSPRLRHRDARSELSGAPRIAVIRLIVLTL